MNESLTGVDQTHCTAGFAVRLGSAQGFLTAGHCFENSEQVFNQNGGALGIVEARSFPGDDFAFVVLHRGQSIRGAVQGYSSGVISVRGATPASIGSSVCRTGFVSQIRCGTILARNVSATAETNDGRTVTIFGLTSTSACSDRGDSGGPFIAGDQAQGILSAQTGNCSSRSPVTMFQPIDEPLSRHGLTLITE